MLNKLIKKDQCGDLVRLNKIYRLKNMCRDLLELSKKSIKFK